MNEVTHMLRNTTGNSINIHYGSNYLFRKEIKRFGKWIQIDVDKYDSISDSPRLRPDGNSFVLREEDLVSPIFIRMLIDQFKTIIC